MKKHLWALLLATPVLLTGCATDGFYSAGYSNGYSSGVYYTSPSRSSYYYSDPWPYTAPYYRYGYGVPYYGPSRPIVRPPHNHHPRPPVRPPTQRPPHPHPRPPGHQPPNCPHEHIRPATPLGKPQLRQMER